jgi:hypothetical protein
MDTASGRWIPVGTSKTPEMDVTGLNEGKEYCAFVSQKIMFSFMHEIL